MYFVSGSRSEIKRRSVKDILIDAGQTPSESVSPVSQQLAEEVLVLLSLTRKQQRTIESLREELEEYRTQTVAEFLSAKGVEERTIKRMEDEIKNRHRDPRGYRFSDVSKAHGISLERVGGPGTLVVEKSFWTTPSLRTVRKQVQHIRLKCGFDINGPMLRTIKLMATKMSPEEKIVTVVWDETQMEKALKMCETSFTLLGFEDFGGADRSEALADKVLLFMVQGLFRRWSFPFAFFFCCHANK